MRLFLPSLLLVWSALLSALFSVPCSGAEALTVLCFGDSITEGKTPKSLMPADRWTARVGVLLAGRVTCVNEGKGGRAASAVGEFAGALQRTPKPDLLIVALGTNDSRDDMKEGAALAARVTKNIAEICAAARAANPAIRILVCAPYNINPEALKNAATAPQREANLKAIGAALAKWAQTEAQTSRVAFANLYGVLPAESLTSDGVHPDKTGQDAIARTMAKALEPLLK